MKLKMNDSKTEYILIGVPQQLAKCTNTYIDIRGNVVHASDCVRNLISLPITPHKEITDCAKHRGQSVA